MKIIDLFFYTTYLFLIKLGRSEDNAKWSALCHISAFFSVIFVILAVNDVFGRVNRKLAVDFPSLLIVGGFFFAFSYFRFYKTDKINKIEEYYLSLSKTKTNRIKIIYGMINILTFILFFLFAFINKGQF